jgi:anthranilate synthase component 2
MFLLIDNYDSFTYNLWHYLSELGAEIVVEAQRRPDRRAGAGAAAAGYHHLAGSGHAGAVRHHRADRPRPANVPLLGVCLGHQAIGEAFGGDVVSARRRRCTARSARSAMTARRRVRGLPDPFNAPAIIR